MIKPSSHRLRFTISAYLIAAIWLQSIVGVLFAAEEISFGNPNDPRRQRLSGFPSQPRVLQMKGQGRETHNQIEILKNSGGGILQGVVTSRADFEIELFSLKYNPGADDGKKVTVAVNGLKQTIDLYDWELLPIVKLADSEF
ncbi:MAG: hypothetical protein KF833_10825, partial [Verrucomicrobiae bacterium]|nr:hypothetical protein [Verrucomicrobiae bacterium]